MTAGCASSPQSHLAGTGTDPALPHAPQFDSETGAIVLRVLTEELQPIPGAVVRIIEPSLETTSDERGESYFDRLVPSEYALVVGAHGFQDWSKRVSVAPGTVTEVRALLLATSKEVPFSESFERRGVWQCPRVCELLSIFTEDNTFSISYGEAWASSVVEITTRPQSAFAPNAIRGQIYGNYTRPDGLPECHASWDLPSPARIELVAGQNSTSPCYDGPIASRPTTMKFDRIAPRNDLTDPRLYFQQPWTAHIAVFYIEPHPAGFSSLPDG